VSVIETKQDGLASGPNVPPLRDRFTLSYTLWAFAFLIFPFFSEELERIFRFPAEFLAVFFVIPAAIVFWVRALGHNLLRRQWRRSMSIVAAPVLAVLSFYLLVHAGASPSWITFETTKPKYLRDVATLPNVDGSPRMKAWDWGLTGGALVTNVTYVLVYDESDRIDQVKLEPSARSPDWQKRADVAAVGNPFFSILHPEAYTSDTQPYLARTSARHLDGHFYLVTHED
jgi:hypothetical protein